VVKNSLNKLKENTVLYRYFKGAFWAVTGNVVVKGLSLLASIFVARFLGKEDFGGLAIIKTTLSVFSLFATLGLGFTVTKFIADRRSDKPEQIPQIMAASKRIITISGVCLGILIALFAHQIAVYILKSDMLTNPLRISGAYLFLSTLNIYQVGVIGGLEAYKKMAKTNAVIGIISFPTIVFGAFYAGLSGVFFAMTFNLLINWYLFELIINKETRLLNLKINVKPQIWQIKKILKFSYPLALSEGLYSVTNWVVLYLLLIKTNYGEVGLFNSANQWMQMILFLPASLSNVLLSFLSNQTGNRDNYLNILKTNVIFNLTITVSMSILIALIAPFIFEFYGESFQGGASILIILVFATIPHSIISVLEQVCISNTKTKLVLSFKLLRQSLLLIFAIILFWIDPKAISLAVAWVSAYSTSLVIMILYMNHKGFFKKQKTN
jgi:O-antigen/teichoic acid export membrane protein